MMRDPQWKTEFWGFFEVISIDLFVSKQGADRSTTLAERLNGDDRVDQAEQTRDIQSPPYIPRSQRAPILQSNDLDFFI